MPPERARKDLNNSLTQQAKIIRQADCCMSHTKEQHAKASCRLFVDRRLCVLADCVIVGSTAPAFDDFVSSHMQKHPVC